MNDSKLSRILNKEILLLVFLAIAAVGAFVFTRHLAAKEQRLEAKIAEVWFERGVQYMGAGDTGQAIQSFRKATGDVADNRKYVLALAGALTAANDDAEAEKLLLQLRESDPEDPEINISLACLAAKRGAVQDAVHYYQNALYGRWATDAFEQRRRLRFELVRFLLDHQEYNLAFSELLILQGRTPESAPAHLEVARLFQMAGDPERALTEYGEAARLDADNSEALIGAGETLFNLGNYAQAEHYLRKAIEVDPTSPKTQQLLDLAQMVEKDDPLAPRLSSGERQTRLLADLDRSLLRLELCLSRISDNTAVGELQALESEARVMQRQLNGKSHVVDADAARSGVDLIYRMQQASSGHCGQPTAEDQALLLIGREHNGNRP